MTRRASSAPFVIAVAALGVGLGVAIAGLPDDVDDPFRTPATTVADAAGSTSVLPTVPTTPAPTTTAVTTTAAPTTAPPTTPAPTDPPATEPPPTEPSPTDAPPVADELVDRAAVRIVLANGDGRFNLVGINAARLRLLGYVTIDQTDVTARPPQTIIFARPGFEDEAVRLAEDLQTPFAAIEPLPPTPVTVNDELGDLIAVLGPDAIR